MFTYLESPKAPQGECPLNLLETTSPHTDDITGSLSPSPRGASETPDRDQETSGAPKEWPWPAVLNAAHLLLCGAATNR